MCWRQEVPMKNRKGLIENEKKSLRISDYRKFFAEAPATIRHVDIQGGGEPLLYPHISELLRVIKKGNISGYLITNGCLLSNQHISTMVACQWDEVRFSINAGTRAIYKKVNGADDYDAVIHRIIALRKKRANHKYPIITLFYVIQKNNIDDIDAFIQLAKKLRVNGVNFSFLSPFTTKTLMIPKEKIQKTIQYLKNVQRTLHINHNIQETLITLNDYAAWGQTYRKKSYFRDKYCQIIQTSLEISSQGLVVPCCFAYDDYRFSTLKEKTIAQIWDETKAFRSEMAKGRFHPFCYRNCSWNLAKKFERDVDPA